MPSVSELSAVLCLCRIKFVYTTSRRLDMVRCCSSFKVTRQMQLEGD